MNHRPSSGEDRDAADRALEALELGVAVVVGDRIRLLTAHARVECRLLDVVDGNDGNSGLRRLGDLLRLLPAGYRGLFSTRDVKPLVSAAIRIAPIRAVPSDAPEILRGSLQARRPRSSSADRPTT